MTSDMPADGKVRNIAHRGKCWRWAHPSIHFPWWRLSRRDAVSAGGSFRHYLHDHHSAPGRSPRCNMRLHGLPHLRDRSPN